MVDVAPAGCVAVAPEAGVAVAVILPSGVVQDRVQAQTGDGHPHLQCGAYLPADVAQPPGAAVVLAARLRDEHRAVVALPDLLQHLSKWAVVAVSGIDG